MLNSELVFGLPPWAAVAFAGQCAGRVMMLLLGCVETYPKLWATAARSVALVEAAGETRSVDYLKLSSAVRFAEHWMMQLREGDVQGLAVSLKWALLSAESAANDDSLVARYAALSYESALTGLKALGRGHLPSFEGSCEEVEARIQHCLRMLLMASELEGWSHETAVSMAFFGFPASLHREAPAAEVVNLALGPTEASTGSPVVTACELLVHLDRLARAYGLTKLPFEIAEVAEGYAGPGPEISSMYVLNLHAAEPWCRYVLPALTLALKAGIAKASNGDVSGQGNWGIDSRFIRNRSWEEAALAAVQESRDRDTVQTRAYGSYHLADPREICERRYAVIRWAEKQLRDGGSVALATRTENPEPNGPVG